MAGHLFQSFMTFLVFVSSFLFHTVYSQRVPSRLVEEQTVWTGDSVQLVIVACLCLFIGIYFMSLGFPLFIVSVGMVGFVLGAIVTWVLLSALEPSRGYPSALCLSLAVGVGTLFALVNVFCWRMGLFLLCGVAGYAFSLFVWSWKENFIIEHAVLRHSISLSVALLFAVLAAAVEFATVITSLSFLGAWIFVFGLDLLLQTGFSNCAVQLLLNSEKKHLYYTINTKVYAMLTSVLALWLIACGWQLFFNRGKRFGLRVIENTNNTLKTS